MNFRCRRMNKGVEVRGYPKLRNFFTNFRSIQGSRDLFFMPLPLIFFYSLQTSLDINADNHPSKNPKEIKATLLKLSPPWITPAANSTIAIRRRTAIIYLLFMDSFLLIVSYNFVVSMPRPLIFFYYFNIIKTHKQILGATFGIKVQT